jgi:aminopeptidase
MIDPRVQRLANVLVTYSLQMRRGQRLAILATPLALPLASEVYRIALLHNAYPEVFLEAPEVQEILLKEGSDKQLIDISPLDRMMIEKYDARLLILSQENTRALQQIHPTRLALFSLAHQQLLHTMGQRGAEGTLRWCVTLYPTQAYAQDTGMSLTEFEDFVYRGCFVDTEDSLAHWQKQSQLQDTCIQWLTGKQHVHLVGKETDLTFSIKGRTFVNGNGRLNHPDGEIYSAPVEDSVNGYIRISFPAVLYGRVVEGIFLRFENGAVVEAVSAKNQDFLHRMLALDRGACRVGEIAFGMNFLITQGIKQTLFDEKIGGTFHLALGSSLAGTGGQNLSAIHWDMVCDLRNDGKVYVDDELFCSHGLFLPIADQAME